MPVPRPKRRGFISWVGKMPWYGKWQLCLVFLPRKFHAKKAWLAAVERVPKRWTQLNTKKEGMTEPRCCTTEASTTV